MRYFLAISVLFISTWVMAQRPFVNSLSKTSATVGETVMISGSNFSPGNMQVTFGAGTATITNTTPTLLEVVVPASATYGPVVVTNTNTRRSGYSSQAFVPSFSGGSFDANAMGAQQTFATNQRYTYDLCACDFDQDNLVDVAVSNNNATSASIFKNTSSLAAISFTNSNLSIGFETISAACGDLNGDGLPELIFTSEGLINEFQVAVFTNTSSAGNISFSKATEFKLPHRADNTARGPRKVKLADIDGDGRKDLVIGNTSDNTLHIYRNSSTDPSISFADPDEISVTGALNTGALDVGDLNNNGLSDIAIIDFNVNGGLVHILQNQSSPGSVKFFTYTINNPSYRQNITIADFDGDNKKEIATTSSNNNEVDIFENTSSDNTVSFNDDPVSINTTVPYDLKAADMNGDGLVDIAVSSRSDAIIVLENNGGLSFTAQSISTALDNRHIAVFDANGDAKPDLATTNNSGNQEFGNLTVVKNDNCVIPEIGPEGLTFCTGAANEFTLTATNALNVTYAWDLPAEAHLQTQSGNEVVLYVDNGVTSIDVKVTVSDGSCSNEAIKTLTLAGGTIEGPPAITIDEPGVVCGGTSFTLQGPAGQDAYLWTLPDGSTATGETLLVEHATPEDAGNYELKVQPPGGCFSESASTTVEVNEPPQFSIANNGEDTFCEGTSVLLEVPDHDGFTYQWRNDEGDIDGATAASYTAEAGGNYTVVITNNGCERETVIYPLEQVELPVSSFTSEETICVDTEITFTSTSTGADGFALNYIWDFGDGSPIENDPEVQHTFTGSKDPENSDTTYTVSLTTAYSENEVAACSAQFTRMITVSHPPTLTISAEGGQLEKCPNDGVTLSLPAGLQSYVWVVNNDTISNTESAYITTGPSQDEVAVSAHVVTEIGCEITGLTETVSNYNNSRIVLSAVGEDMVENEIHLQGGVSTVELTASNGKENEYVWTPADILKVSTDGSSVVAYPKNRETTITVSGIDRLNECETTAAVTILTEGVIARKSFSPNGDGMGYDCWEILNSDNLTGCKVYIFDQRGRYVFQGDAPFENNCVWNGNIDNGSSQAPEGIYYFVMKCDASDNSTTGTILLAR